jgi:hypothetical protein
MSIPRQAFVRRKFFAVVHGQRVSHLIGHGLEGADSGPVQERRALVRHEFCQKKLGFSVSKGGNTSVFPALSMVPPSQSPARGFSSAVFYSLPAARFCLKRSFGAESFAVSPCIQA